MSTLDKINATLANGASAKVSSSTTGKRGFTVPAANATTKANAKGWVAAYDRGVQSGKFPRVGFSASSPNFLPMVVVAMIAGFTSEADAIAKVRAVQVALGVRATDRNNLGLKAMASPSAIVREKTMRSLAVDWIARADAKGVYKLVSTKPSERVAARAVRPENAPKPKGAKSIKRDTDKTGQGTRSGRKSRLKGAEYGSATERRNGPVVTSVDKALRSQAKAAERATLRAANRVKQAAQGKVTAKDQALADGAAN